jgi:hypothetical protein
MNVIRRLTRGRPITLAGTLAAMTTGLLFAVSPAEADDWQLCIANQPDQVPIACTAVVNQASRGDIDIARAYAIRGEWFRVRKRNEEALADFGENCGNGRINLPTRWRISITPSVCAAM